MAVRIGSNIASLQAQRRLAEGTSALSRIYERLSSGQRINVASDDAAGLSITSSLTLRARVFTQGIRNLNDGLSALNIADSAVEQLSGIVIRLQELAERAANGTFSAKQRNALDAEAQALSKEYFRISASTGFNGRDLLNGSTSGVRLQAGFGLIGGIDAGVGGAIGNGTFGGATSWTMTSGQWNGVALGDLNNDGILDMVTAGTDAVAGYVAVKLGTGNGSFGAATLYAAEGTSSNAVCIGDVNGDGILDLVSAGYSGGGFASRGYATVRLGTGDGSFGAATSYASEFSSNSSSKALALGDLNGDGILDLITAGVDGMTNSMHVRLGIGNGTFGAVTSYTGDTDDAFGVALGDLNGDGILDVVTVGGDGGAGAASVRLGRGNGTFGAATLYTTDTGISEAVRLGDLNGDGILDLVTVGSDGVSSGSVTVRLGTGSGSFGAARSFVTEDSSSEALSLGDVNGDGILDLITSGYDSSSRHVHISLGRGNGTFQAAGSYTGDTGGSWAVALGDVNGDGVLDLVTAGAGAMADRSASTLLGRSVSGAGPLLPFSLRTLADARQALPVFENKLAQLAAQRGQIGGYQARIVVAMETLQASAENYRAAAGRIQDADIAAESSELVRQQILQNATVAVLAQANQQPALAIKLLSEI